MPKRPKSVKVTSPKKGQVKVTWKNPGGISKVKIGTEAKGEEYKIHTVSVNRLIIRMCGIKNQLKAA